MFSDDYRYFDLLVRAHAVGVPEPMPIVSVPGEPIEPAARMALPHEALPIVFTLEDDGFRFAFADAMLASYARKLLLLYLGAQVEPDCDLFAVELVFGELISNVARHAPGPLELHLRWQTSDARLEVIDTDSDTTFE